MKQLLYNTKHETKRKGSLKSEKTVRQLLGELYVDKEYLEKLLLDEGLRPVVASRAGAVQTPGGCLRHSLSRNAPATDLWLGLIVFSSDSSHTRRD